MNMHILVMCGIGSMSSIMLLFQPCRTARARYWVHMMALAWLMVAMPQSAMAACNGNFGAINESFKLNRDDVLQAIKEGCRPPADWLHAKGKAGSGLQGYSGKMYLGNFKKSGRAANDPMQYYRGACNTYDGTRPGGLIDLGADTPCLKANGYGMFSVNQISGAPIPNSQSTACLSNLFSAITGIISGGGTGGGVGNPNITGGATVSSNCVSGSIGVCGLGAIGGQICNNGTATAGGGGAGGGGGAAGNGQPFSATVPPQYIQISGVSLFNYVYNTINANSSVFLPQGGVLTYGARTYTVPVGGFVTMSRTGMVYIGRRGGGYVNIGTYPFNQGIQLSNIGSSISPATNNFVSIVPNQGIIQPNSSIVTGSTIGSTVSVQYANTVQGQNTPANQSAITSVTNTPSAGPTLTPPTALSPSGTPFTGSFPPLAISTLNPPPNPNANIPAVVQQYP
jgi:hypothetical protein